MTGNPAISIIVPVFNTNENLSVCIESILNQTFKDIELILVDDGSTDGSGKTCDEFSQKDQRVIVIHKKNRGVSSARNTGLNIASGDYIGWVDSDDYIAPDMFELLYSLARQYDADISECNFSAVFHDNIRFAGFGKELESGEDSFLINKFISGDIYYGIWTKLFRRSLFDSVRFPEGRIYEDTWLVLYFCLQNLNYVRTPESKYYYRQTDNSIIRSSISERKAREFIYNLENQLKLVKIYPPEKSLLYPLLKRIRENGVFWYLGLSLAENNKIRKIYAKIYGQVLDFGILQCLKSENIPFRNKVSYIFCKMGLSGLITILK
jgi:glycosyltransferase involved in cell wall biosynthesis